jgi:type VI secretion system protein ImpL
MKKILRLLIKGFLLFTLLALAALLLFGLVLWIGWPWWVGFFAAIGLAGLLLGILAARKILVRRREQMFVHQVIAQDESMQQGLAPKELDAAKELQARWKEAIDALRRSHLRKQGNPLYVLPWYMVIGESGSGKTTAIQSARLSSPFAEMTRTSGISGTRNCDWWFFEQAILIDTAGRYALPVDEGRDKEEWQNFLTLLAKFRKKEPLNGLVVTVAADHLAQAKPEALQEDGRAIRRRIEELTRVLGARSPVYILVTKCDLIQGATQFCDQLPEAALNQAMGFINQQLNADGAGLVNQAFRAVGDRLRDLRLLLLHKTKDRASAATMLIFPEEFEKLRESLAAFVKSAFQENPYQESPLLRGIFFSSGRQEGTPFSHFLGALGLIQAREVLPGTNKGLFLHDFFARVLPTDRHLFRPSQHMQQWRILTRNLGLTAWVALLVAACGLLSYAFVKNLNALSEVRREFQKPALLQGELVADVIIMDRFRQAVVEVEAQNRNWWIPRLGLNESLKVEADLKRRFVSLYQNGFMREFDKAMGERMTGFSVDATPNATFGAHVAHLVRRINMVKTRLAQDELAQLAAGPQPVYGPDVLGRTEVIAEIQARIGTQYLYALAWEQDGARLTNELTHLQTWLKHLLTLPGATLNWLADWVDADPSLAAVRLQDFWGTAGDGDHPGVPAAFTLAGKAKIDSAIAEIEAALFEPLIIAGAKTAFAEWYQANYFKTWEQFAKSFDQGSAMLGEKVRWQAVARRIPTPQGPYLGLIERISTEFQVFDPETAIPSWVGLAYDWQEVSRESRSRSAIDFEKAGLLRKATRQVTSKIKKAERAFGVKVRAPMDSEAQLHAAKALLAYQQALEAMVKAIDSRHVAFDMASALYQQDPATGDSPFLAANRAVADLKTIMADAQDDAEALFWDLINGNNRFMQTYVNREAACHLQALWEKQVLLELQDVSADRDMAQVMMGSDGYATQFIRGPAAPFVARSLAKGYHAKSAMGLEIAFDTGFLTYLSKGAQAARPARSSYNVSVRGLPTGTNPEAQMQPHATILELQCASGTTQMENLNYPVAQTFAWSPQNCGDVVFRILVGNVVLSKTYSGHHAFARFLNEFKTGQRIFKRNEFPEHEAALRRMGIQQIRVRYQFQGQGPVLELLYSQPGRPPRKIVSCWE